jgi:hypothetical protein
MEIYHNRVENKKRPPCSSREVLMVIATSVSDSGKSKYGDEMISPVGKHTIPSIR